MKRSPNGAAPFGSSSHAITPWGSVLLALWDKKTTPTDAVRIARPVHNVVLPRWVSWNHPRRVKRLRAVPPTRSARAIVNEEIRSAHRQPSSRARIEMVAMHGT